MDDSNDSGEGQTFRDGRISLEDARKRGFVTRMSQIPNIERVLGMKVINNPDVFTNRFADEGRILSAACCSEAAYLATAFGPKYLDQEIGLEQFLEAFQVGSLAPQTLR